MKHLLNEIAGKANNFYCGDMDDCRTTLEEIHGLVRKGLKKGYDRPLFIEMLDKSNLDNCGGDEHDMRTALDELSVLARNAMKNL